MYSFSVKRSYSSVVGTNFVFFFDSNKAFLSSKSGTTGAFSFTTPANCEFIQFRFGIANAGSKQTFSGLMICEGSVALPYEPYTGEPAPDSPIPIQSPTSVNITSFGGNLLPVANGSAASNGATVEGVDGTYTLTVGDMTGEFYVFLYFPSPIKLKPGTYYYHLRNDKTVGPGQTISTALLQSSSAVKISASDVSIEGNETNKVKEFQLYKEQPVSGMHFMRCLRHQKDNIISNCLWNWLAEIPNLYPIKLSTSFLSRQTWKETPSRCPAVFLVRRMESSGRMASRTGCSELGRSSMTARSNGNRGNSTGEVPAYINVSTDFAPNRQPSRQLPTQIRHPSCARFTKVSARI